MKVTKIINKNKRSQTFVFRKKKTYIPKFAKENGTEDL